MNLKKIIIILFIYVFNFNNLSAVEPNVFVQSTVNKASEILSKNITKDEKIEKLKIIAKESVDIKGVGFYSLGSIRKSLNDDQKEKYLESKVNVKQLLKQLSPNTEMKVI